MMGMRVATVKALMILVAVFIICASGGLVLSPTAAEEVPLVPAVYVFGDSTMDVGNNMYLGNFPLPYPPFPYGIDFTGPGPNGRFSNGYNMADSISKLLGFDMSPPPFLSLTPETSGEILKGLGGVNYASGGSGILDTTHNASLPLSKQVEYFAATKANMTEESGGNSTDIDALLSKSLFLISDGGNDMLVFYVNNPLGDAQPFYDDLVSNYTKYVKTLYGLGARRFGVIDVPPIGCVPVLRAKLLPWGENNCLLLANHLAGGFNEKLSGAMAELAASLPGMKYSVGSSYKLVLNFTGPPEAAGFNNVNSACCGGGNLGGQAICSSPNTTYCDNRDDHLFWDGLHCTQAASNKGAKAIYDAPLEEGFAAPINFKQLLLGDQPTSVSH
ncbi:GDSL esterase/lipase APG-like [Triticum dicoccoides]|uniref:GDSL esterase/lipase APG-like n=1 Tax=Triticum dicoccoides TaxID=85692 RepID=UPI0018910210|nr:GDSL esterase/lipase APG-like [Triticum dicoccoides]